MTYVDTLDQQKVEAAIEKHGEMLCEKYGVNDPRFALWLMFVDRQMLRRVGVTHRDIADWDWWSAYEGGETPSVSVRDALADDDTYGVLFRGEG